jgi:hypothetical protein
MKDEELRDEISFYEEFFKIKYSPENWWILKFNGEHFIKLYANLQEIPEEGIKIMEVFEFKHRLWSARMILGIGCELIIKSAYLKKGFIINKFLQKKNLPKNILRNEFIYRFTNFKSIKGGAFPYLDYKVHSIRKLIENLSLLFDQKMDESFINENILLGFQISRIWRNSYAHGPRSPHDIFGNENELIFSALDNLYEQVFNERFDLLKDKKLIS